MTAIYAIIGDPVAQVRSPAVFNARFQAAGIDAVMVPLHVTADRLSAALDGLRLIENLSGVVITVPHKPAAARLLRSSSPRVRLVGAANVLRPMQDGWEGDLFDGEGFAMGLAEAGFEVAGKRCAIVGAGGAGAAIAFALAERRVADLMIDDVDETRASDLASGLRTLNLCPVSVGRPGPDTDLAVNATPLGMTSGDSLPIDLDALRPTTLVADAVMKPPVTPLLAEWSRRGGRIQEGCHMLDSQIPAIWQFLGITQVR